MISFISCQQFAIENNKDGSFSGSLVTTRINSTLQNIVINKSLGKEEDEHYFFETNTIEAFNLYKEDFSDQYNVYRIDFNFNNNIDKYIVKGISFDITSPVNKTMYFIINNTYSENNLVCVSKELKADKKETIFLELDYDAINTPENNNKGLKLNFCSSPSINQNCDILVPKILGNFSFKYLPKEN